MPTGQEPHIIPDQYQSSQPPAPSVQPLVRWIGICALGFGLFQIINFIGTLSEAMRIARLLLGGHHSAQLAFWLWSEFLFTVGAVSIIWGGFACLVRHPYAAKLLLFAGITYGVLDVSGIAYTITFDHRTNGAMINYLVQRFHQAVAGYVIPLSIVALVLNRAWASILTSDGLQDSAEDHGSDGSQFNATTTLAYARRMPDEPSRLAASHYLLVVLKWTAIALGAPTVVRLLASMLVQHTPISWMRAENFTSSHFFWANATLDWASISLVVGGILLLRKQPAGLRVILVGAALGMLSAVIGRIGLIHYGLTASGSALVLLQTFSGMLWEFLHYAFVAGLLTTRSLRQQIHLDAPVPTGVEEPRPSL